MDPASPLFYVVMMAGFVVLGQIVTRYSKFYARETGPASGGRYEALDGARGFLALGVFFHHAVIYYFFFKTGLWTFAPTSLYAELGSTSVAVFFMITGFLFWSKAIRGGARMKAQDLYVNRVRRIVPMCLFSIVMVLCVVAVISGFHLVDSPWNVAGQVIQCLTLGLTQLPTVNGVAAGDINAWVLWTLQLEWIFYLALPVTAFFATPRRFIPLFALGMAAVIGFTVVVAIVAPPGIFMARTVASLANFLCGMAAAHIVASVPQGRLLTTRAVTLGLLVPLAVLPAFFEPGHVLRNTAMAFLPFLAIAFGNDYFGILRTRGAKFLGSISYSVYLMHGIVLYCVLHAVDSVAPIADMGVPAYWGLIGACGVIVVAVCGMTYRWIEKPFIAGKRLPPVAPPAATTAAAAGQ
jgi:peptidoglycan/LPS O-acetylase OafA/YrhL